MIFAIKGEDDDCAKLACGVVSDIANALGEKTAPYLSDFVPALATVLKEPRFDRDVKL